MTKPVEAPAETWQVDSLVGDLVELESRGEVAPTPEMGLDQPKFKIEIAAKGGKNLRFAVGNDNKLGSLYVRVENKDKADVVSNDVYERLSKPYNELRDKQLVGTPSTQINQLAIQAEGQPKLTLQRKGGQWHLVEPQQFPADESVMTDLLGAITGLRAMEWVSKDSAEASRANFEKPRMTVSFTTTPPATQPATQPASQPVWTTIAFGQYEDVRRQKVFARLSDTPAVVKVAVTPLETLNKKPIDLRDKKLIDIVPEQVSKLAIVTDVPAGPAPTTKPAKHTEVVIERRKEVAGANAAATFPATKPAATQVAATQPTTRPATQIAAATQPATQAATTQAAAPTPPPSPWVLKTPPGGDADEQAVRNFLDDLRPLRVSKYLESTPTTKPTANHVVRLTTEGPGGTPVTNYELKLIDPGGDKPLTGEYNGLAFELPRTFATALQADFAKKKTDAATTPQIDPSTFTLPGEDK
jgi:hypothetical protein